MYRRIKKGALGMGRFFLLVAAVGALHGCANLTAVREFGKTAAELSSYSNAGRAYQKSAETIAPYLTVSAVAANGPGARQAQVTEAYAVQDSVTAYFATLAKLAGEDAFSLDKELDAVEKGLNSLPAGTVDASTVGSAVALTKSLQNYVLAGAQASAVKGLVSESGPLVIRLLTRLETVAVGWRGSLENDSKTVLNSLSVLSAARDTPPLLSMLARDRQQQHQQDYAQSLKQVDTAISALRGIRAAHEAMAANLGSLEGKELQAMLKEAVSDLKAAKKNLEALR